MSDYDFATVRIYEMGAVLEAHFSKDDTVVRAAVKKLRGSWDRDRKVWRIDVSRIGAEKAVQEIREAILRSVPKPWAENFTRFERVSCVTRRFGIVAGVGGFRVKLPAGHHHEYTLRDKIPSATEIGREWALPATHCGEALPKKVIADILQGDRDQFSKSVDYMEGFALEGELNVDETDALLMHLVEGKVVFVTPEFVLAVDSKLEPEPLKCYPMHVLKASGEVGHIMATLAFITGSKGYSAAERFAKSPDFPIIDTPHLAGKWRRKRA